MTQEQKQFIIKALQSGIPAIAKDHIAALEEVEQLEAAKTEELVAAGVENFQKLTQVTYETIIKTIAASYPMMANEFVQAFIDSVNSCIQKFNEIHESKQKAEDKKLVEPFDEKPVGVAESAPKQSKKGKK